MLRSRIAALAVLACLVSAPAFGLSCARPSLDEAVIDGSVMIFEGRAGPKRPLLRWEVATVRDHRLAMLYTRDSDLQVFRFTVSRAWKGAAPGQVVEVLFNTHWGDGFANGESYLVVSPREVGGLFWSPLCGHSLNLRSAADIGNIATLERVIGIGEHVRIPTADRVCRRAEDCTSVQTHCGGCSCGTPVAKSAADGYPARLNRLCATIRVAERCEMDCPTLELSCVEAVCVAN
ncbi:MAG: hypothetical protein QNJ67_04530 [Kiloniellales bacterium]|nr:hypothetical protein [Kiloniellales bacterium]